MSYRQTIGIVSLKVLNEDTGEIENKRYSEEMINKKTRGGYSRMYKDYDTALAEVINSKKDFEIFVMIRDQYTYARIENIIHKAAIAKVAGVSERKVTDIVTRMVASGMLGKVSRGVYRLNPFMYLPFRAEAEQLQSEWKSLFEQVEPQA